MKRNLASSPIRRRRKSTNKQRLKLACIRQSIERGRYAIDSSTLARVLLRTPRFSALRLCFSDHPLPHSKPPMMPRAGEGVPFDARVEGFVIEDTRMDREK